MAADAQARGGFAAEASAEGAVAMTPEDFRGLAYDGTFDAIEDMRVDLRRPSLPLLLPPPEEDADEAAF